MRCCIVLLLLAGASATSVTPIQKVLTMMNDMLAKAKAEKESEAVTFAEFSQFCKSNMKDKEHSITKGKEKSEQLSADIDTATSQMEALAKEIAGLDGDIATWDSEMKEQAFIREKAHADFVKTHDEYTESIASVEQAVSAIKEGGGASFVQEQQAGGWPVLMELQTTLMSAHARKVIQSFLQRSVVTHNILMQDAEELDGAQAPKGQSGGVLEMVEGLGSKFEEERDELEKAETNENQAFQMMAQDLTNQISAAKRQAEKKTSAKGEAQTTKADAEGDLADVSSTLESDEKFLSDLTADCEQKAVEFEQNQETRQGEIDAINKAIEIMSSDKVSLEQAGAAPALVQFLSEARSPNQGIVSRFLAERARASDSQVLSLLSVKVASDPFKKVTKMIKDMIVKLMEEASEEAEHKGFCDTELGSNKITRDSKTEEAASLQAEIDELTADIAKMSSEIASYGAQITDLDAAVAKATKVRSEEKEKNTATVEDAKVAQEAVAQALTVLKDFYEKAAKSAALAQETSDPATGPISYDSRAMAILNGGRPALLQEPYKGMESGGVVGMLEVIASDFARLESETASAEAEAAREYTEFMNDSEMDKAAKSTDMKHKENERVKKESALAAAKKDLAGTTEELDAAMAYFEKLKPSCVDAGETYEERVARRKEEIESLQEALKVLSDGI